MNQSNTIKHVSFDFWDTLCTGNPNYINRRVEWISGEYTIAPAVVRDAIMKVKRNCDSLGIETLTTIPRDTQWLMILNKLGIPINELDHVLIEMVQLFWNNPPEIIIPKDVLMGFDSDCVSTSITCNTGLASAKMIFDFIADSWLQYYFDFYYWSDEQRYFKPNPIIGSFIVNHQHCLANSFDEILHIGDNDDTDGKLARSVGMQFVHFNKSKLNYQDIFENELYPRS